MMMNGTKSGQKGRHLMVAALCLAGALLLLGFAQTQRVASLQNQVNAAYQKALYETVALMESVQINLEKLLVSGGDMQEQLLLSTIARQCEGVQNNLSSMPLNPELTGATMKFVNQTGDYARVLGEQVSGGAALKENDVRQLIQMHESAVQLNGQLATILQSYERGELVFEYNDTAVKAVKNLQQQSQPLVEYPVLLYDGPFSDARQDVGVSLVGQKVDKDQSQQALVAFIGADRVRNVRYIGESNILSKCFEFEADTTSGILSAGVTEIGAHVLYMLPLQDVAEADAKLTQGECIDMAQRFLESRGFTGMDVSYWRQLDGILTVNFCATQSGVLLYPDLIKVQVSMKDGLVIGVEAGNYLKNHRTRSLVTPVFTEQQAVDSLGAFLTADRVRQCVIPVDSGEAQCWEISAHMTGGNRYLVYKDVVNGDERNILRVVEEADGVLAQ